MLYKNYFKGKTVVITGGNGFFGSHIADSLKKTGCRVFIPKTSEGIDFRKSEDCVSYLSMVKPDVVINCAANQGGIGYHGGRQADLFMDNILMGTFLMRASQKTGVKKFVNIIAGCSYPGYLEKDELSEEDYWSGWLHDSIFSYGFSRKASAVYSLALKKQFGFNSINLIMANMYGPREHFNPEQSKALAGLIKKIHDAKVNKKSTVTVWGTGKPIRDWLYVRDGVEGVLRAAALYNDVEPINIATGYGISVKDLAEKIKKIIGYKGKLVYDTSKQDGALHKTFGIKNMVRELKWKPKASMEKGIRETYEWFKMSYKSAIKH